jgi:hypothetical protein
MRWIGLLMIMGAVGCAGGQRMAEHKPRQHFTGNPYEVWSDGDRVSGQVCGLDVELTVTRSDEGHTVVSGFAGGRRPVWIEVQRGGDGVRHIHGSLGSRAAVSSVDLAVSPMGLAGRSGLRRFELAAAGDSLRGSMSALNTFGPVPALVEGRGELERLPDEALAAILPALLNCDAPFDRPSVRPPLAVRVGGPAGYEPRYNNEIAR